MSNTTAKQERLKEFNAHFPIVRYTLEDDAIIRDSITGVVDIEIGRTRDEKYFFQYGICDVDTESLLDVLYERIKLDDILSNDVMRDLYDYKIIDQNSLNKIANILIDDIQEKIDELEEAGHDNPYSLFDGEMSDEEYSEAEELEDYTNALETHTIDAEDVMEDMESSLEALVYL